MKPSATFTNSSTVKKLALCLLALVAAALPTPGAIICVAPTSTTAGSLQITSPITFTITTAGTVVTFALDKWVTSDGNLTVSPLGSNLAFAVNGTAASGSGGLRDNYAATPVRSHRTMAICSSARTNRRSRSVTP